MHSRRPLFSVFSEINNVKVGSVLLALEEIITPVDLKQLCNALNETEATVRLHLGHWFASQANENHFRSINLDRCTEINLNLSQKPISNILEFLERHNQVEFLAVTDAHESFFNDIKQYNNKITKLWVEGMQKPEFLIPFKNATEVKLSRFKSCDLSFLADFQKLSSLEIVGCRIKCIEGISELPIKSFIIGDTGKELKELNLITDLHLLESLSLSQLKSITRMPCLLSLPHLHELVLIDMAKLADFPGINELSKKLDMTVIGCPKLLI